MVRAGWAWAFTRYQTDPAIPLLEAQARAERAGLWADTSPVPPWRWRAHNRHFALPDEGITRPVPASY